MILRVESISPPGVLNSISTASSLFCFAASSARPMYSSVMGLMVSATTNFRTSLAFPIALPMSRTARIPPAGKNFVIMACCQPVAMLAICNRLNYSDSRKHPFMQSAPPPLERPTFLGAVAH